MFKLLGFLALFSASVFAQTKDYGYLKPEDQVYYKNDIMEGNNKQERLDSLVKEINKMYGQMNSMKAEIQELKAQVEELKEIEEMKLYFKTPIDKNYKRVSAAFTSELFLYLTPSWLPGKLIRFDGCKRGNEVHIELGHPKLYWVSEITDEAMTETSWHFIDEGKVLPWPLKKWRHKHSVVNVSEEESLIVDDIEYECGNKFLEKSIFPMLYSMFSIRPSRYKKFFKDHA